MTGTLSTSLSKHHWAITWNSHVTVGLRTRKKLSFEMEEVSTMRNILCSSQNSPTFPSPFPVYIPDFHDLCTAFRIWSDKGKKQVKPCWYRKHSQLETVSSIYIYVCIYYWLYYLQYFQPKIAIPIKLLLALSAFPFAYVKQVMYLVLSLHH